MNLKDAINTLFSRLVGEDRRKYLIASAYRKKYNLKNLFRENEKYTNERFADIGILNQKSFASKEIYRGNCFYGAGESLRIYSGVTMCLKACIEHGVYFGDYTNTKELNESGLPALITFGSKRVEHIKAKSVPTVCIGPYIAYADPLLTTQQESYVRSLFGKTLLVFPSHSIDTMGVYYDVDSFIDCINAEKEANGIDTVLICLYYKDAKRELVSKYLDVGYKVVTAGCKEDRTFLSRLRSIIDISDLTLSNSVGTHIGYCAYLGKPHKVITQEIMCESKSIIDKRDLEVIFSSEKEKEQREVAQAFSEFTSSLTIEQERILKKYWGFDQVKTRSDLREIFQLCEIAYKADRNKRQEVFAELIKTV